MELLVAHLTLTWCINDHEFMNGFISSVNSVFVLLESWWINWNQIKWKTIVTAVWNVCKIVSNQWVHCHTIDTCNEVIRQTFVLSRKTKEKKKITTTHLRKPVEHIMMGSYISVFQTASFHIQLNTEPSPGSPTPASDSYTHAASEMINARLVCSSFHRSVHNRGRLDPLVEKRGLLFQSHFQEFISQYFKDVDDWILQICLDVVCK